VEASGGTVSTYIKLVSGNDIGTAEEKVRKYRDQGHCVGGKAGGYRWGQRTRRPGRRPLRVRPARPGQAVAASGAGLGRRGGPSADMGKRDPFSRDPAVPVAGAVRSREGSG